MTREIKFRAWDKYNERWLNISSIAIGFRGMVHGVWDLGGELYGLHQVDLISYTGLKDKNGTEIYEGDILVADYGMSKTIGCVEWMDDMGTYAIHTAGGGYSFSLQHSRRSDEVIGNIYENGDLLK